jgi:hypothetical protein
MKLLHSKLARVVIVILLVSLISLSLSSLTLLNFPWYYHQNSQQQVFTLLKLTTIFSILTYVALKLFILPYLKSFLEFKNIIFIFILFLFLTFTIGISSNYYWAVPEISPVKICFDAEDDVSAIEIKELNHAVTNELFPPDNFGSKRYPLELVSGDCLNGSVMTFWRPVMWFWNPPGMTVVVKENPPDGRLFVSANNIPSVIYFDQDAENPIGNEVKFTDGFDQGSKIDDPYNHYWFWGLKALGVIFSSLFLSLFFFSLTQRIIDFSSEKQIEKKKIKIPLFRDKYFSAPPIFKILLAFTLIYFILFGTLMIHISGQPDQSPHAYYSRRYSETWGFPEEKLDNSRVVTGQPYLYHWLNGAARKILNLFFPSNQVLDVVLWRSMSVALSTITVFYCYKLASKVSGNPYAGVLAAFFLSNTLMFVFMSGGISYDNLMNLASMAAIYHLVSLYKKEDFLRHTMLTGIWVIVGAITKEQFLLMTLIIFLAWVFFVIRNFKKINLEFNKSNIILSVLFIIGLALFIGLYGVNLVRYGKTTPSCYQVKDKSFCGAFSYRSEFYSKIEYPWLWFRRDEFPHNPISYAFDFWINKMIQSTWGILSHVTFIPKLSTALHSVLLLWSFLCLARYWKIKQTVANLLIYILLTFVGFMFIFNYKQDIEYQFQHYAVSGRYLFPSIGAFFALMTYYFLKIRLVTIKRSAIILAIVINFSGGLWMFLSRYSEVFSHWRLYFTQ